MMASLGLVSPSRTALWLIFLALARVAVATFWTVTEFYQISLSTSRYGTYTDPVYTYTTSYPVKSGVTPTATPVSSTTYVNTYLDLTEVTVYLPPGAVAASNLITTTQHTDTDHAYTAFVEPIVYTAPASCPTAFTVTTQIPVYIPSQMTNRVSPTSISTSVETYGNNYTYITAFLSPNAVPLTQTPGTTDFVYSYYIANCRNPTATGEAYYGPSGGGGSSSGGGSEAGDDDDDGYSDTEVCAVLTSCKPIATYVIVIASVLPSLFILGFLESWFWFRNLMLGRTALRFGTVCWILISLWVICATRLASSRTAEDQADLRKKWSDLPASTRIKLWFKWGFCHAYPTHLLGPDPKKPTGPGQDAPPIMQMQPPPPGNSPFSQVAQPYAVPPEGPYQQGYAHAAQYPYYSPQGGPQQP